MESRSREGGGWAGLGLADRTHNKGRACAGSSTLSHQGRVQLLPPLSCQPASHPSHCDGYNSCCPAAVVWLRPTHCQALASALQLEASAAPSAYAGATAYAAAGSLGCKPAAAASSGQTSSRQAPTPPFVAVQTDCWQHQPVPALIKLMTVLSPCWRLPARSVLLPAPGQPGPPAWQPPQRYAYRLSSCRSAQLPPGLRDPPSPTAMSRAG